MPTILYESGVYFRFYTREHEPIHVHIRTGDGKAKFDICPEVRLVKNQGVKSKDLRFAEYIIEERKDFFIAKWEEVFGSDDLTV